MTTPFAKKYLAGSLARNTPALQAKEGSIISFCIMTEVIDCDSIVVIKVYDLLVSQ